MQGNAFLDVKDRSGPGPARIKTGVQAGSRLIKAAGPQTSPSGCASPRVKGERENFFARQKNFHGP